MLAHRLRHRITIQKPDRIQDPNTGAMINGWATVEGMTAVPAEVLTGPGREFRASGAVQAETAARINLRWFPGLLESWRILWDGKTFDIGSIETDATGRREYRLVCKAGVSNG